MAETRSGDYDLIVIGIQRQKWQHFLLDDLTHQIIEQVDRPVLILK
jgi:nucleotide-binding universal stress UspA family protein